MSKSYSRRWTVNGSNTTVNIPGSTTVSPKSQTFSYATTVSGGINPGYKQAIASGLSATTTLSVDARELEIREGTAFASYSSAPGFKTNATLDGLFPFTPAPTWNVPSFNSIAESRAVATLYRKIRETHNQFLGGVFVGEIRETVRLIVHPIGSFTKLTLNYLDNQKRLISATRKSGRGRKSLKANLSDNYLKWTFGVVPLMSDIADISKTLQRSISDPPRVRFVAKGSYESGTSTVLAPISTGNIVCSRSEVNATRSSVKYYGAFKVMDNEKAISSRIERIRILSGFTLRDFVPTVWNLLPYSFVADYFINIGDVLEAATTDTSKIAWLARTQACTQEHIHNVIPDAGLSRASGGPTWQWYAFSGSAGGFTASRTTINRASANVPIMAFRSKFADNSGRKIMNLLALIGARM
jgi:hypothetical protein